MSDQIVCSLTEILQQLQYPHSLSVNSFRTPNFEQVAGILGWMIQRLDPTIPIHEKIATDDDKVALLNGIAAKLAAKMNLNMDTINLYAADSRAAKELVKIAKVLQEASHLADEVSNSAEEFQPEATLQASEKARSLVSEITEISSRLTLLLKNESEDSKERANALLFLNSVTGMSGNDGPEQDHVESHITRVLESTNAAVEQLDKQCKILISNQRGMEEKIRKKTIDLERTSKRLESLRHVRPAYMDEYEQLEEELQVEYERYVVRLRNADYLEDELSLFKQAAIERQNQAERSMKRMQKKFREEELRILNGGDRCGSEGQASGYAISSVNPTQSGGAAENEFGISVDELSRADASSARSTPREHRDSFSRSEGTPSEPSSGGRHSFDGSEMTGSMDLDDDDSQSSDDNF